MMRFTLLFLMAALSGVSRLAAEEKVEVRGVTSVIKIEEVIFGHLSELNGKFKLRASELTFAPGAFIGGHHHIGPGIRYVISSDELSYGDSLNGDHVIFNAWAASSPAINRFMVTAARKIIAGKDMVYFKRHYKDGSTRPVRLRVNDFVAQHV